MSHNAPTPVVMKETKNKIRVDYEGKMSFKERVVLKLKSSSFWVDRVWFLFRFILMIGISYVILSPFLSKIMQSFMAVEDFKNATVNIIPLHWTFDTYKYIIIENHYFEALLNTATLSLICALLQTFVCCMVGYGLAKFKFKGNKIVFLLVILTMAIPHSTLELSMLKHFRYFDIFSVQATNTKGILALIFGEINLMDTYWPMVILSVSAIGFKNGLYIFMMVSFFKGVPDELEESAYVDGCGTFRTFMQIILPTAVPMMITIFLFAFSWQWTDEFYTELFFSTGGGRVMLPNVFQTIPESLAYSGEGKDRFFSAVRNAAGILIILPLVIIYLFCQRFLVQGIERSGIVG